MEFRKIKVLIVEDSPSVQDLLIYILGSDPEIEIIGTAYTGKRAIKFLERNKPDIITMDMDMPEMDGLEATRIIMETNPVPIIIVTASWSPSEVKSTYKATEVGAIAIMEKPRGIGHPDHNIMALELIQTVKLMSKVKVVKRWRKAVQEPAEVKLPPSIPKPEQIKADIKLVAFGASTGGPVALQKILSLLPKNLPVPILIVQHIAKGFLKGFVEWLNDTTDQSVHIAVNNENPKQGNVYVAPNGFQMGVKMGGKLLVSKDEPENSLCPSVSYLFRSVAEVFRENAIGVLLTGMGKDGAYELKMMKEHGAVTIAQSEESSVIYGMSGVAVKLGAAKYILSPEQIAGTIEQIVKRSGSRQ
jgi:two-component system chemotaxis response regulator CheB